MSQEKKGKITIANILALVGLAGIGVVTFFGMQLHSSDGTPGTTIIGAVALVAGLGFLLMMSIKAKKADNNPDKWRYVEWACLVIYVVVAAFFATPFQLFFYMTTEKSDLQAMARAEVQAIQEMYQSYEFQQGKYMTNAKEQIDNYIDSGQFYARNDTLLANYVQNIVVTNRIDKEAAKKNVANWKDKAENSILRLQSDKELSDIAHEIEVWNIMNLSSLALRLEKKDKEAWTSMETKIREFGENNKLIPVIGGGGVQPYYFDGYAKFDLGTPPQPKFAQALRASNGNTALGWIVYVVLNLLVLLNYLATSRSAYVGPRRGRKIGGLPL